MTTTYPRELHLPEFDSVPVDADTAAQIALDNAAAKLAATVRWLYVHCFRDFTGNPDYGEQPITAWDGGTDGYGRKTTAIWPKLAKMILAVGAEPTDYIRAQFWGKTNARPPAPNTFYNEGAVAAWRAFCCDQQPLDDKARELHNDRCSVENAIAAYTHGPKWPYDKAVRFALCDKSRVYATPLYRYCAAIAAGHPRIAAYYFERALLQLLFRYETYTTVYGELIPLALHQAVRDLREYLGLAV